MLIFTRAYGTRIRIGDDIIVDVLGCEGQFRGPPHKIRVRLGIIAPDTVKILREEVYQRNQARRTTTGGTHGESEEEEENR